MVWRVIQGAVRRLAVIVAAFFLQWLPTDAASFANFPWDRGGATADETAPDEARSRGKRRRGSARRSDRADQPRQ